MTQETGYVEFKDETLWFFWGEIDGEIVGITCYVLDPPPQRKSL
jgi:hypothetical protein